MSLFFLSFFFCGDKRQLFLRLHLLFLSSLFLLFFLGGYLAETATS